MVLSRFGISYTLVDQTDLDAVEAAVTPATKLVWVETPTNPTLKVIDVPGVVARSRGAIIARDPEWAERLHFMQRAIGAVPGPQDCFLVHRGLRTLHLRMRAHAESAEAVVAFLGSVEGVTDVRWPGFSGMVSFRHPEAVAIAEGTEVFTLAESLGGVESLIEVPAAMTHQSVEDSDAAVPADFVRLSCGVEAPEDLVEDLARAIGR